MKDDYDFSNAGRGRFFRQGATLIPPVHLEADVFTSLKAQAGGTGMTLDELVNALLRQTLTTGVAAPS